MLEKVNAPPADRDFAEAAARFGELVAEWERFLDEPDTTTDPPDAPCWRWGHTRFWQRAAGKRWVCGVCHPPKTGEKVNWHTVEDESRWRRPKS